MKKLTKKQVAKLVKNAAREQIGQPKPTQVRVKKKNQRQKFTLKDIDDAD
jgi:hypothetical protein